MKNETLTVWDTLTDTIRVWVGPLGEHHEAAIDKQGYCEIGLRYIGAESVIRKLAGR